MVANQYARIYRNNSILTATPAQLVLMMYDGALAAMAAARVGFDRPAEDFRRFEAINHQLRKASRIIAELRSNLDFKAGGEFAQLMDRLYGYYLRRLREANVNKEPKAITEVEDLLRQIRNSWAEMLRRNNPAPEPQAALAGAIPEPGLS